MDATPTITEALPTEGRVETLAEVLARGPLPLGAALRHAAEIATALRDLHQQKLVCGQLDASRIWMEAGSAQLAPVAPHWKHGDATRDVRAFGELLWEMVTGSPAPEALARIPNGSAGVRSQVLDLAAKCMAGTPRMQHVVMEIRLHGLALRQPGAGAGARAEMRTEVRTDPPVAAAEATSATEAVDELLRCTVLASAGNGAAAGELAVQAKVDPAAAQCYRCGHVAVFASKPRSDFEEMLRRWQIPICRCHICQHRYLAIAGIHVPKPQPQGVERRRKAKRK